MFKSMTIIYKMLVFTQPDFTFGYTEPQKRTENAELFILKSV